MQTDDDKPTLDGPAVRRRFDAAAADFDSADFVHRETCDALLARLQPVVVDARTVVDLGGATGAATATLSRRFRGATIVDIDLSIAMLARARRRWRHRPAVLQADAGALPLADASVDVVFANLLLPWIEDPDGVFAEVARVLVKGGVFAFASLGPDSLRQLRESWLAAGSAASVHPFPDMHELGDALVRAGLADPVLDVDRLTVTYEDPARLYADLTATGARNSLRQRHGGLTGRRRFEAMQSMLFGAGRAGLELELVYGHCWGAGPRQRGDAFAIDAGAIPTRRRQG